MRLYALFYFVIFTVFSVCSQENGHLERDDMQDTLPKIFGVLKNYQKDYHKELFINYTVLSPDFQGMKQRTSKINDDGSFKIDIEEAYPHQKVRFMLGDLYQGFLITNSNLQINIDLNEVVKKTDHFESKAVTFNGDDGTITQFYNKYHEYKTDKKSDIRRSKYSSLRNRTSHGTYKVKQLSTFYEELEKIEAAFCKKNGSEYRWILENERYSEFYGDLASIFIGKPIPADLWKQVLDHKPLLVSDMSNRFYAILATKLWSHEEKEIRAFSRLIFKADAEDEEAKKEIDLFMVEQDKRNAGVSYDNEIYANGLEKYITRYESKLADAKLDLFLTKMGDLPVGKKGLVAIKGQPLAYDDRRIFVERASSLIAYKWQVEMMKNEMDQEVQRIDKISTFMSAAAIDGQEPKLGTLNKYTPTGAGLWTSKANNVNELLRQIRDFYKEKSVLIYIWNTGCSNCTEELKQAGLTYDKIEDEPVDILTMALNQNTSKQKWEDTLVKTFVKGQHIFLDKKLTSEIIEYFQLPPVPCYLYISGEGEFIPYKINSISDLDIKEVLSSG